MKTVLDGKGWFLQEIAAREERVEIVLAEGIGTPETEKINGRRYEPTCVNVSAESRYFAVIFDRALAWLSIMEDYTSFDSYNRGEGDTIKTLTQSRFLDFLRAYHGWMFDMEQGVYHYRIWTYDRVIDIASDSEPVIEQWRPKSAEHDPGR